MKTKELWIATNNPEKVEEFKSMLSDYEIKSLLDLPEKIDIKEDGLTFEANALIKAKYLASHINKPTIGDDSGLCITAMNDWPGVHSKRWAWPTKEYSKINLKLLKKMKQKGLLTTEDRKAKMVTVIAYYDPENGDQHIFKGVIDGVITLQPRGEKEFGYDQIFEVENTEKTFSELKEQKNLFSHRRRAINKFLLYINNRYN